MKRLLTDDLILWANDPKHYPLILRGARQVGKTHLVESFGRSRFNNLITINFELEPRYRPCFEDLNPQQIIQTIELLSKKTIIPSQTLLFLDEIQACPKAIAALRYFKEKMPDLHVIAAGSLLEFALKAHEFSMPVGRVTFRYLRPLSFQEFLLACQHDKLLNYLKQINIHDTIPETIHQELLELTKQYFFVGGMPAVVADYAQHTNWLKASEQQSALLQTYRNDFPKYSKTSHLKYLERLFERAPLSLGQTFKYSTIDPDMLSRELKIALRLLIDAGIVIPIHATHAAGLPLALGKQEKKFKLAFIDIGLAQRACGIDPNVALQQHTYTLNQGAMAEQFVAQELIAHAISFEPASLYYWERNKKNSSAEVDYVIAQHNQVIPIEVKAGKTGRLKSLQVFMQEKNATLGIQISQAPFSVEKNILSLPFYMMSELTRLTQTWFEKT